MAATQPARLGEFEFDAIIKRPETLSSKIPDYATEEGYSVSDNVCLEPVTLDVEAVVSNAPVTWADRHVASFKPGGKAQSKNCVRCGRKRSL